MKTDDYLHPTDPLPPRCIFWNLARVSTIGMTPGMFMIGSWRTGIVTAILGVFSHCMYWRSFGSASRSR